MVAVDASLCIRCAACAVIAPRVFALGPKGAAVRAQPAPHERAACRAAALICPTGAIAAEVGA